MKCLFGIFSGRVYTYGLLFLGLAISFTACAKEIPSLTCEIAESRDFDESGETVLISFKTKGIPENTPIILESTRIDNVSEISEEKLIIGKNGYLNPETFPEIPFRMVMNMFPGEPMIYKIYDRKSFVKNKKKPLAITNIVAYPLETKDGEGRRIFLVVDTPDLKRFTYYGEGFKPSEHVYVTSESEGEIITFEFDAESDGTFKALVSPGVIGKKWGSASLTFQTDDSKKMRLKYKWGREKRIVSGISFIGDGGEGWFQHTYEK